jgi:hypothetical protein
MINPEFSIEFDILYNNISSNKAPGLNEYEKSVFLTKAQEQIVTELYSGRNTTYNSFEETEEQRRYLNTLVETKACSKHKNTIQNPFGTVTNNSTLFDLPNDVLFITYESARVNSKEVDVHPVSQDELSKILKNPFRGPSNNRVLRLDIGDNIVELISINDISSYKIRYIRKPNPIILTDLEDDLSINGISEESECELDSSLHRTILDRAVALALQTMYSK